MAERADLDAAFADLATAVTWPATPDLVTTVAGALERPMRRRGWATPWPRAVAIAIVATLLLAAAVAAAVLVLPGLRLTFVPTLPPGAQDPLGSRMRLLRSAQSDPARAWSWLTARVRAARCRAIRSP